MVARTILVVELEEKTEVKVGELVVVEVVMKVEVAGVKMVVVEVRGGADAVIMAAIVIGTAGTVSSSHCSLTRLLIEPYLPMPSRWSVLMSTTPMRPWRR